MSKKSILICIAFLVLGSEIAWSETPTWLTDEQARDVAKAEVHNVYPQPCYSTYRDEHLEDSVLSLRKDAIVGNHLNNSVYFYRVASDVCRYVSEKDGRNVVMLQISNDCCEYGVVAVDRVTAKSYWFGGEEDRANRFRDFVRDEQLHPDSAKPVLFTALYLELVWGESKNKEITDLRQLRDLVRSNFQSAYSPYQQDTKWHRKFETWWRHFRSRMPQLKLETTYEPTNDGAVIRGYGFAGFQLTIPRSAPPPKGTPELFQWALLVRPDGTVEERPWKVVYSSR